MDVTPSLSDFGAGQSHPVELIAEALRQHRPMTGALRPTTCTCRAWTATPTDLRHEDHQAAAIAASVASWPAPTQAQLLGGEARTARWSYSADGRSERVAILLPWTAPAQLIGDTE